MKILLVNSTKSFYNAVQQSIGDQGHKVAESEGTENVADDIQSFDCDAVLVNWATEDFDIEKLCRKLKKIKHSRYLYVIVVTKRDKQDALTGIIKAGGDDFIFKPFGREELIARLEITNRYIHLEGTVKDSRKKVLKFVKEDPHTGLFNRRSLMDEVLKEMGRSSREMNFMSSIMTDITNFKELTGKHGAEAGDQALFEFSSRLKSSCRPYDKLGRYGISNFIVFLPDTGKANAKKVADRILDSTTSRPFILNDKKVSIQVSIGIAELDPNDVAKSNHVDDHLMNDLILDSLIRRSELAMQKASKKGKNTIEIYQFS